MFYTDASDDHTEILTLTKHHCPYCRAFNHPNANVSEDPTKRFCNFCRAVWNPEERHGNDSPHRA